MSKITAFWRVVADHLATLPAGSVISTEGCADLPGAPRHIAASCRAGVRAGVLEQTMGRPATYRLANSPLGGGSEPAAFNVALWSDGEVTIDGAKQLDVTADRVVLSREQARRLLELLQLFAPELEAKNQ